MEGVWWGGNEKSEEKVRWEVREDGGGASDKDEGEKKGGKEGME